MKGQQYWCGALLVLLAVFGCVSGSAINKHVTRSIDLTTQLAYHNVQMEFENEADSKTAVGTYSVVVASANTKALSMLRAWELIPIPQDENEQPDDTVEPKPQYTQEPLKVISQSADTQGNLVFEVLLREEVQPGNSVKLMVDYFYTHAMRAVPESIAQGENQFVVYEESHTWFTPYKTASMYTKVKLSSPHIIFHSQKQPTNAVNETIMYGQYTEVMPMTWDPMRIHFENNAPFLTITKLEREIEISMWGGNVAVEEWFWVTHGGAKLTGPFSRLEMQRDPRTVAFAISSMSMMLPKSASDIYYRDEIGNISTSVVMWNEKGVELAIQPRFPLFGEWKTSFYIGYNLPMSECLFKDPEIGALKLQVPFAPFVDFSVIDHVVTRVVLPEGSKYISSESDLTKGQQAVLSKRKTYLDTIGRTVVELHADNLFSAHNEEAFVTTFTFSKLAMLQEPLLLIAGFFSLFLLYIAYSRIDLSIAPATDDTNGQEMEKTALLLRLAELASNLDAMHAEFFSAFEDFKVNKQAKEWGSKKQKTVTAIEGVHKTLATVVTALQKVDKAVALRAKELVAKEEQRLKLHEQVIASASKKKKSSAATATADVKTSAELTKKLGTVEDDISTLLANDLQP